MHRSDVADFETVWTLARVRAEREGRRVVAYLWSYLILFYSFIMYPLTPLIKLN